MSPVFRHGGLRLYLLKLLDEAPRHGYDVIRLLQDRFLGVYSPSPGTIYPRLARLEEEGLVTHETVDGKKIYKITDAGRAELNRRLDDLADLEDELAASVRDIAREISRDVRETVRSLRDELTFAVREAGRAGKPGGPADARDTDGDQADAGDATGPGSDDRAEDKTTAGASDQAAASAQGTKTDRGVWATSTAESESGEAQAQGGSGRSEDPRPQDAHPEYAHAEDARPEDGAKEAAGGSTRPDAAGAGADADDDESRDRRRGDWRDWTDWTERGDWREWADWARRQPWGDWAGVQDWKDRAKAGAADWSERAQSGWAQSGWAQHGRQDWIRGDWTRGAGPKDRKDRRDSGPEKDRQDHGSRDSGPRKDREDQGRRDPGPDLFSDLEHLAAAFAREIRGVARQAENAGEDAVGSLGRILGDTLNRIRTEVFKPQDPPPTGPKDSNPPTPPNPPAPEDPAAPKP